MRVIEAVFSGAGALGFGKHVMHDKAVPLLTAPRRTDTFRVHCTRRARRPVAPGPGPSLSRRCWMDVQSDCA